MKNKAKWIKAIGITAAVIAVCKGFLHRLNKRKDRNDK